MKGAFQFLLLLTFAFAAVFLITFFGLLFEVKGECQRENNVYECRMIYVPIEVTR